jgi:hypothetical protein
MIYSTSSAGDMIHRFRYDGMPSYLVTVFRWLIHVSTLCDL